MNAKTILARALREATERVLLAGDGSQGAWTEERDGAWWHRATAGLTVVAVDYCFHETRWCLTVWPSADAFDGRRTEDRLAVVWHDAPPLARLDALLAEERVALLARLAKHAAGVLRLATAVDVLRD